MFHSKATLYRLHVLIYFFVSLAILLSSCSVVKNYPKNKPFVYETNIKIEGEFSTDDRKELTNQLQQQLHDSLQARRVQVLIGTEKKGFPLRTFYTVLKNPPVYDSINADKSLTFMKALLNAQGYYRDTTTYSARIDTAGDQYRTTIDFTVHPGKLVKIDSIWYNIGTSSNKIDSQAYNDTLQRITLNSLNESVLQKGKPFAKPLISTELNRLVDLYRNNGYLRFSFDDLVAVWDTVGLAIIRPTLDPIEQAQQLEELQRRRANPTADIEIRLRTNDDTTHLTRYYVGNITAYPDITTDTADYEPIVRIRRGVKIISYYDLFKRRVILDNIYLRRGDLYSQKNYLRTLNRFNALGAWRLSTIDQLPRAGTDTVDFVIKLVPARKYLFNFNIEGSKNWGNSPYYTQGDLLGLGINLGLQNRNFARAANQSSTNLRYGVELNASSELLQSRQVSIGHTISFPRIIPRLNFFPQKWKEDARTVLAMNVGNFDRKDYFNITNFSTSWGYNFNWNRQLLSIRFPNVEYSFLNRRDSLDSIIKRNQSYRYIFNSGLITSTIGGYSITFPKANKTSILRFNVEGAGLIAGFSRSKFLVDNLYRFVKFDADFRQTYKIRRTEFAWRVFAGSGVGLPRKDINPANLNEKDTLNFYLPFFRQYYGGGANSMRAWALRKLGPGSAIKSFSATQAPDRFGDLQFELNAEYRFYLTEIGGVRLNSALFTDIGNVWFVRKNKDFENGEFRFNKFFHDLAIGVGTGLRVDFGLFVVRLDWAYKAKDPSPDDVKAQNKWFYQWRPIQAGQLQLGVNYPF